MAVPFITGMKHKHNQEPSKESVADPLKAKWYRQAGRGGWQLHRWNSLSLQKYIPFYSKTNNSNKSNYKHILYHVYIHYTQHWSFKVKSRWPPTNTKIVLKHIATLMVLKVPQHITHVHVEPTILHADVVLGAQLLKMTKSAKRRQVLVGGYGFLFTFFAQNLLPVPWSYLEWWQFYIAQLYMHTVWLNREWGLYKNTTK